MYLLAKWLLLGAGALTAFYVSGFVFIIVGDPVHEFTAVLDLLRSVAMTVWVVWAVVWSAGRVLSKLRQASLGELARDLGVTEGGGSA